MRNEQEMTGDKQSPLHSTLTVIFCLAFSVTSVNSRKYGRQRKVCESCERENRALDEQKVPLHETVSVLCLSIAFAAMTGIHHHLLCHSTRNGHTSLPTNLAVLSSF